MGAIDPATKRGEIPGAGRNGHRARWFRDRARGDEGAALVEFALILPILAIVVFGTVDLGRAYQLQNEVTNMAREGAFNAINGPCPTSGPISAAKFENPERAPEVTAKLVLGTNPSGSNITCSPAPTKGTQLTMVVTTEMDIFTPMVAAIVGSEVTITGTASVEAP